jgi:hypothetical protein
MILVYRAPGQSDAGNASLRCGLGDLEEGRSRRSGNCGDKGAAIVSAAMNCQISAGISASA